MKNITFLFAVILLLSGNAAADVKVKIRQSVAGQTTENTTYIKGKRQRSEQSAGGVSTVTITQCDLKRSVQLNPQTQVFLINSWADDESAPSSVSTNGRTTTEVKKGGLVTTTVTTKDTGETRKMFGFTARHLIITFETESSPDACSRTRSKMVTDGWYIDAAFALDCDGARYAGYAPKTGGGCTDRHEMKQIGAAKRGYPVIEKMTMFDEAGRETLTMTNEVVELTNQPLDAALFDVPAGYREVQSSASLYTSPTTDSTVSYSSNPRNPSAPSTSGLGSTVSEMNADRQAPTTSDEKKPGVIRIGLAGVKVGSVGEGINAAGLAGAIENSLLAYLKGTNIEIVTLEAKLPAAIQTEASEKQCDYVLVATVSHKKGGGGFGMFSKVIAPVVSQTGIGQTGSRIGNVVGQVATQAIYSAASASAIFKSKDELSLEIGLAKGATGVLTKSYKAKAKSAGEDIISPLVEQAATAIVETAK